MIHTKYLNQRNVYFKIYLSLGMEILKEMNHKIISTILYGTYL